jgi:hypothetical protein
VETTCDRVSHHHNDPDLIEKCARINCYHLEQFAYFVAKMKNTPDGDGSHLDHSALVYGSGLADSNLHDHFDLPTVIVGNAGGRSAGLSLARAIPSLAGE